MAQPDRSASEIETWVVKLADDLRDNAFGADLRVLTAAVRAGDHDVTLILEVEYVAPRGGRKEKYVFHFRADELFSYVREAVEAFDDPKFPEHASGESIVLSLLVESLMTELWSTSEPNYIDLR